MCMLQARIAVTYRQTMAVPFFEDEEEIPVPEEDPVIEVIEVCGAWSEDDSDVS